jgi:hypothetical protein
MNFKKIYESTFEDKLFYRGTGKGVKVRSAYYFSIEKRVANTYANMKYGEDGIIITAKLHFENPIQVCADEIKRDNLDVEGYSDEGYDGAYCPTSGEYVVFLQNSDIIEEISQEPCSYS